MESEQPRLQTRHFDVYFSLTKEDEGGRGGSVRLSCRIAPQIPTFYDERRIKSLLDTVGRKVLSTKHGDDTLEDPTICKFVGFDELA